MATEAEQMSTVARMEDAAAKALLAVGGLLRRAEVSPDGRALYQIGGREADTFYRDRWSYDKVVRSTHGVNCTGSCSWKVYVKDGIITWEQQQTDYPSVGRGPAGVRAAWLPARGGVLLVHVLADPGALPVRAGRAGRDVPARRRRGSVTRSRRGRTSRPIPSAAAATSGPAARAAWSGCAWDEALEMVAAAHVHAIKEYGPDRVAGFSPIPAMSMVSHAVGARFISLIGGSMLSFYDWYADLPVASPQMFGDQTDVPESADWWDAAYLMMWGSNVPVTRTPDAHWMAEARYRGQKVVVVVAGLRRQREVRRRVAARPAGHRRRAGDGDGPRDPQGVLRRPDRAALRRLRDARTPTCRSWSRWSRRDGGVPAGQVPHRRRPRARRTRRRRSSRSCGTTPRTRRRCRTARSGSATARPASAGGTSTSAASSRAARACDGGRQRSRCCCRASTTTTPSACCAAACRPRRSRASW